MFKNKYGIFALTLAVAAMGITGCSSASADTAVSSGVISADSQSEENDQPSDSSASESFSIVCTIFPEYDWTKEILGSHSGNAELSYLLDNGADLHNYQPTADDIVKISTCDLFIYVGGESDEWAVNALSNSINPDMKVINLMDVLGDSAKVEELKEGMQESEHEHDEDEEEHEHEHEHDEDEEEHEHEHEHEEGEVEYDEHVWLSLKNAEVLCTEIEKNIEAIDPSNAADYKSNLESYISELDELDSSFRKLVDGAAVKTLVFGDRFPFRYFVDDYGLDYYAAFIGCSAESEASFKTINFLADKINELDCDTVYTLENSNKDIASSVINNSGKDGVQIAELNSLQSVSQSDIANGASYISLMQKNYKVLCDTLK